MFIKAVKSFVRLSDSAFFSFCEFVLACMIGNSHYTTPTPSLASIQLTLDAFGAAITAAGSRDRVKIAAKKQQRVLLIAQMRQLCNYVNTVATTEEAVASSGFEQSKVPQPRHIYAPAAPTVSPGMNPGTINSQIIAVKGATSYLHQILAVDAPAGTEWTSFGTSRAKFIFDKLESGVVYRIRVIVLGSNQQVAYSPESVQVAAI